jgi:hypothetical protein
MSSIVANTGPSKELIFSGQDLDLPIWATYTLCGPQKALKRTRKVYTLNDLTEPDYGLWILSMKSSNAYQHPQCRLKLLTTAVEMPARQSR